MKVYESNSHFGAYKTNCKEYKNTSSVENCYEWVSEFQDSQSYTEKPCLEKTKTERKKESCYAVESY